MNMDANVSFGVCREDVTEGVPDIGIAREGRDAHEGPLEERAIRKADSGPGPRAVAVSLDEKVDAAISSGAEVAVSATHCVDERKGRKRDRQDRPPCCPDARGHLEQSWCAEHPALALPPGQLPHVPEPVGDPFVSSHEIDQRCLHFQAASLGISSNGHARSRLLIELPPKSSHRPPDSPRRRRGATVQSRNESLHAFRVSRCPFDGHYVLYLLRGSGSLINLRMGQRRLSRGADIQFSSKASVDITAFFKRIPAQRLAEKRRKGNERTLRLAELAVAIAVFITTAPFLWSQDSGHDDVIDECYLSTIRLAQ
jgi:hypothetical protein